MFHLLIVTFFSEYFRHNYIKNRPCRLENFIPDMWYLRLKFCWLFIPVFIPFVCCCYFAFLMLIIVQLFLFSYMQSVLYMFTIGYLHSISLLQLLLLWLLITFFTLHTLLYFTLLYFCYYHYLLLSLIYYYYIIYFLEILLLFITTTAF